MADNREITIPVVGLNEYVFSPPSSMGWSESEYADVLNQEINATEAPATNLYDIKTSTSKLKVLPSSSSLLVDPNSYNSEVETAQDQTVSVPKREEWNEEETEIKMDELTEEETVEVEVENDSLEETVHEAVEEVPEEVIYYGIPGPPWLSELVRIKSLYEAS
jgi:hypothetical protein